MPKYIKFEKAFQSTDDPELTQQLIKFYERNRAACAAGNIAAHIKGLQKMRSAQLRAFENRNQNKPSGQ